VTDAVWIVPSYPWADQPVGGIFHQTQAQALTRLGLQLTVTCPTPLAPWPLPTFRRQWRDYAAAPARESDGGVTVLRPRYVGIPGEPSWAIPDRLIAGAVGRVRRSWAGARLIHGHSAVTGLAAWQLARRTGLPFVLTFHGSDLNTWPDQHPDRLQDLRTAARAAGAVITVSAALAARVESLTGVKAVHLPIGSDHRRLASLAVPRSQARAELALTNDSVVVLFVGNLLEAKGVRELADAVLALGPPFRAVFVGGGPEKGYRGDDPPARACLDYRGPMAHGEVVRHMAAADVLVLPSRREGLPSVLVEAGSIGLPVIASSVGGIPGLLADDRGVLLEEVSAAAIGAALDAFANDRSTAAQRAARLGAFVRAEHDADTNAGRLRAIYEAVAAKHEPAALTVG
jgi:teichuronic acid biosynthesis glycosyltransferase TuaC